jgi:integrase/recombinase XerD
LQTKKYQSLKRENNVTDMIAINNSAPTAKEFQGLADVPPEVEWFANLDNVQT